MPKGHEHEYIAQKIFEMSEDRLEENYQYKNSKTHLNIICHHCNQIYHVSWNNFSAHGSRCLCQTIFKKRAVITFKLFSDFLEVLQREDYTTDYDGKDYSGYKTKIKVKCPDGFEFETSYDNFANRGRRCPNRKHHHGKENIITKEKNNVRLTKEDLERKITEIFGENKLEIIEIPENIRKHDHVKYRCCVCNLEF